MLSFENRMSSARVSRKLLLLIGVLVLLSVVAYLWTKSPETADVPIVESDDVWPPGRWHSRTRSTPQGEQGEELARVLSLPYTGTGREATGEAGVLLHDPERAYQGVNLYTSGHGPEALLIDMDGNLLHRWRLPFERAFPDRRPTVETPFFRRAHLLDGGDLLALFQGGGLVRLDRRSEIVWSHGAGLYNDLHLAEDGRIFGLAKEARPIPSIHPTEPVLEDSIVVLDSEGRLERRISLLQAFLDSPYAALIDPLPASRDIFHSNTIQLLEGPLGDVVPGFEAGTALVSMREVDIVALVDLDRRTVLWARRGGWDAQHQPELLPTGRILLFDNRGADGASRVLEFEPLTGEIEWEYAGEPDRPLSSHEAGTSQRLPNGNTLITESEGGRALEVTRSGELVWEFVSPHRGGSRDQLVATLFEVLRLPPSAADFLSAEGLSSGDVGR